MATAIVTVSRLRTMSSQRTGAGATASSAIGLIRTANHTATHTSPSPPASRNAACHPNATASAGMNSGVTIAPTFGAVLPMPSAIWRSR